MSSFLPPSIHGTNTTLSGGSSRLPSTLTHEQITQLLAGTPRLGIPAMGLAPSLFPTLGHWCPAGAIPARALGSYRKGEPCIPLIFFHFHFPSLCERVVYKSSSPVPIHAQQPSALPCVQVAAGCGGEKPLLPSPAHAPGALLKRVFSPSCSRAGHH